VGVIGTGSSGIQMIPLIAEQAEHLHVFQRTPNFSVPAQNRPLTPEADQRHKSEYRRRRQEARRTPFGIAGHAPPQKTAAEDRPEDRERNYEVKWGTGGNISFLYAYKDLLVNPEANATASDFVRNKIKGIVHDPAVAQMLLPHDHHIGTKRLCLDNGYFETYNRGNVTLVDVRADPIVSITATGIKTQGADYPLDDIVFATGFDAMTGALLDIDIVGAKGRSFRDKWAAGPRTYLGLMTEGFPNFFMITGPGSPSVKTNMVFHIEQHVDWIGDCLRYLIEHDIERIDVDPQAEDTWVAHVNDVADATLYPLAKSWYTGDNIPGKPRVFMPYVGGLDKYSDICDATAREGYRGFVLQKGKRAPVSHAAQ
jgi:cyclohexanone monooxygenase